MLIMTPDNQQLGRNLTAGALAIHAADILETSPDKPTRIEAGYVNLLANLMHNSPGSVNVAVS